MIVITIKSQDFVSPVLSRLTHLEAESKQQKHTIIFLERKVERHEDSIEKLEAKLKKKPLETEENVENHVYAEDELSASSTSSNNRGKRPVRLFPAHILHRYAFM